MTQDLAHGPVSGLPCRDAHPQFRGHFLSGLGPVLFLLIGLAWQGFRHTDGGNKSVADIGAVQRTYRAFFLLVVLVGVIRQLNAGESLLTSL